MSVHVISDSPLILEIPGEVKIPGTILPCRSVILEVAPKSLWMWSPVRMTEEDIATIKQHGSVDFIIAPSLMHHLFFAKASKAFPSAQTFGSPGLRQKVSLDFQHDLHADVFSEQNIRTFAAEGIPMMDEFVFYHEESRTVIFTDLIFNLRGEFNFVGKATFTAMGTLGKTTMSRLVRAAVKDRKALKRSLLPLKDLAVDRIVMAHGDIIEDADCPATLSEALTWALK